VKPKSTISITFQPEGRVVQASQNQTLLEAALAADVDIGHSCGGNGTCGTCRVRVIQGLELFSPRNEIEAELAEERGFTLSERLCCQNTARAGMILEIPKE
jgi:2Fe-2S ferredoxin